jgi:predicted PurR-regulated permease PerM
MVTKNFIQREWVHILLIAAMILFFFLLQPFSTLIIIAIIVVYLVAPLYSWLQRHVRSGFAMLITWVFIILCLFLPLIILWDIIVHQIVLIFDDISAYLSSDNSSLSMLLEYTNRIIQNIPFTELSIDREMIQGRIMSLSRGLSREITSFTTSFWGEFVSMITSAILLIFTISGLLATYEQLILYLKKILPLPAETFDYYRYNLWRIGKSMIKATLIIALVQAVITVLSLRVIGVPYLWLWWVLAFLLGMIPMIWSSFIAIPIGIVLLLLGNVTGGIVIILVNQIITNNVDNILRPRLVDNSFPMNGTLVLMSVFGWMYYFGLMGVIYWPVIMWFCLMTFDIYMKGDYLSLKKAEPHKIK